MYHTRMFSRSSVYFNMVLQVIGSREGFTTCIILVWVLSSMYFNMALQVIDSNEGFTTCISREWFLSSMYFKMSI